MGSGGIQQFLQQFQGMGGGNQLGSLGNIPKGMPSGGNFGGGPQMPSGSTIPQEPLQGPQGIRSPGSPSGGMPVNGLAGGGMSPTPWNPSGQMGGQGTGIGGAPGMQMPQAGSGNSKGGPSMSASILPGMQQMQPMQAGGAMAPKTPFKAF